MQVIANGIVTGLTIAVLALAFAMVYLPTRVFHVALGAVYAMVPYIALTLIRSHFRWLEAALAATAAGVALSILCELANHARLEHRKASAGAHLVSSLGIYVVVSEGLALMWGSETKVLRTGIDPSWTLGSVRLTVAQIATAAISLVLLAAFGLWLQVSRRGVQFRAMADNPVEFSLRGSNVPRLRILAFALSGLLAGLVSLLVSYDLGFDSHSGLGAVLLALVGMIVGGRASFLGAALGGLLLGIVRTETVWLLGERWQDAITFLVLALFLLARPTGLLGRRLRLEAGP